MENMKKTEGYVSKGIKRASEEGVLLYKTNKPDRPVTWDQIVGVPGVREESYYNLEFIVKDAEGNLKEMWFGDELRVREKGKKGRGR